MAEETTTHKEQNKSGIVYTLTKWMDPQIVTYIGKWIDPKILLAILLGGLTFWQAKESKFFDTKKDLLEIREEKLQSKVQQFAKDSASLHDTIISQVARIKLSDAKIVDLQSTVDIYKRQRDRVISDIGKNAPLEASYLTKIESLKDSISELHKKYQVQAMSLVAQLKTQNIEGYVRYLELDSFRRGLKKVN